MPKEYIITGENEDGWFLRRMTKGEVFEYLATRTGSSYEDGDPIDFDEIEEREGAISIDGRYISTGHERFVIIDGDTVDVKPKQVVTEIELE